MRTKTIAYIRVSLEKMAERGHSLESQRDKVVAYAALYDLDLVDIVVDAGASAKSLDRPGLTRALEMLARGEAEALLVAKLDRLTRSVRDLGELIAGPFAPGRATLLSVGENIDARSAGGRLVLNVLASVSAWEREALGERTRDALAALKARGVRLGGEPMPIALVHKVRDMAASMPGASLRTLAGALNAASVPSARGRAWHPSSVARCLAAVDAVAAE